MEINIREYTTSLRKTMLLNAIAGWQNEGLDAVSVDDNVGRMGANFDHAVATVLLERLSGEHAELADTPMKFAKAAPKSKRGRPKAGSKRAKDRAAKASATRAQNKAAKALFGNHVDHAAGTIPAGRDGVG